MLPRMQWIVLAPALALAACASHPAAPMSAPVAAATMPPAPEVDPPLLVADGGKTLHIERNRPLKAGDQYDVDGHSLFDVKVTLPPLLAAFATKGSRLESGAKEFTIAGRVQVVSISPAGKPNAYTFTVKACTFGEQEVLPPGAILDAKPSANGMIYSRRDGKTISREVSQALLGIFDQEKGAGAPPRGKDGSDVPHKIGDTWPVDVPETAQRPVGDGAKARFTDLQGWTTLKSMQAVAGVQAVEVESGLKATLLIDNLPMGFKADPAAIDAGQTILYPVDSALLPLHTDRHFGTEINVSGSFLFMPVTAEITIQMHQTITPVPPSIQSAAK